jgi:hypothetical protein
MSAATIIDDTIASCCGNFEDALPTSGEKILNSLILQREFQKQLCCFSGVSDFGIIGKQYNNNKHDVSS